MKTASCTLICFLVLCCIPGGMLAQVFTRGHYYDLENGRHDGQIAYQLGQNYVQYRTSSQVAEVRLKPEEVRSFVWGVDSFTVKQGAFVRVIVPGGAVRLYEQVKTNQVVGTKTITGVVQPGFGAVTRIYLLEREGAGELLVAERKEKKFNKQMAAFFADAPALAARVEAGEFAPGNVPELVRAYNEQRAEEK